MKSFIVLSSELQYLLEGFWILINHDEHVSLRNRHTDWLLTGMYFSPGLFAEFMLGNLVVKTTHGTFNSVAADMKLEQSIQKSSKSSKGIIGQTRSTGYVTEWCLNYGGGGGKYQRSGG